MYMRPLLKSIYRRVHDRTVTGGGAIEVQINIFTTTDGSIIYNRVYIINGNRRLVYFANIRIWEKRTER